MTVIVFYHVKQLVSAQWVEVESGSRCIACIDEEEPEGIVDSGLRKAYHLVKRKTALQLNPH